MVYSVTGSVMLDVRKEREMDQKSDVDCLEPRRTWLLNNFHESEKVRTRCPVGQSAGQKYMSVRLVCLIKSYELYTKSTCQSSDICVEDENRTKVASERQSEGVC